MILQPNNIQVEMKKNYCRKSNEPLIKTNKEIFRIYKTGINPTLFSISQYKLVKKK